MANFCCPIEMEPKTLNAGQLNHAREVAVDIVQNKEPDEASSIFVEGLKPVLAIKDIERIVQKENSTVYNKLDECNMMNNETTVCQCSSSSTLLDSPDDHSKFKEPFSAPF